MKRDLPTDPREAGIELLIVAAASLLWLTLYFVAVGALPFFGG
jgi:hypothetical protein